MEAKEIKKIKVQKMFDSISHRYDFLNHFLSAGIDIYWRRKSIKLSGMNSESKLLDIACGTGDFAIEARKQGVVNIFGADLSINMLGLFKQKSEWIKGRTVQCVGESLPFKQSTFSHITVAFGVRNFFDIPQAFKSFYNVLKENGNVTVLEFRLPKNQFIKSLYLFYFNKILPLFGKIISRDNEAYTYLPESVSEFDEKINLEKIFYEAGFKLVKKYSLTFGLVQVVVADK